MAVKVADEFGSRANPPSSAYPDGSLKNETNPGVSNDGSPLDERVGNDWEGFKQSILTDGGIIANGNPDSVENPQILNALKSITDDRFNYDGLVYHGVGNISDYAGQQLQEPDKTNAYQYPDNSRQFYVADKSQTFPITIPSDPSSDNGWTLVNAATTKAIASSLDVNKKTLTHPTESGVSVAIGDIVNSGTNSIVANSVVGSGLLSYELLSESGSSTIASGEVTALDLSFSPVPKITIGGINYILGDSRFPRKSIEWFWAIPDSGSTLATDNTARIQLCFSKHNDPTVETSGVFGVTAPILYPTQFKFKSNVPSSTYGTSVTFRFYRDSWTGATDGETALFNKAIRDSQYQSVRFEGISVRGYANISFNDLENAEDIGVHAFDLTTIRDGCEIVDCAARHVSHFAWNNPTPSVGYLGFTSIRGCHLLECHTASNLRATTGVSMENTRIYDCYDWIFSNKITLNNVSFNNSSYSQENCSIHSPWIHATGCWFEGGNKWFNQQGAGDGGGGNAFSSFWKLDQCYLSETFSSSGSSKFMFGLSSNINAYVEINSCNFPLNTRVFNRGDNENLSGLTLEMKGCSDVRDLWGASSSSIPEMTSAGMKYRGVGNQPRDTYNVSMLNSEVNTKLYSVSAWGQGNVGINIGSGVSTVNIDVDYIGRATPVDSSVISMAKFAVCGNLNGAGSSSAVYGEFTLVKGFGDSGWRITGTGAEGLLSNQSLTIAGVAEINIVTSLNEELSFTVEPLQAGNQADTMLFGLGHTGGLRIQGQ